MAESPKSSETERAEALDRTLKARLQKMSEELEREKQRRKEAEQRAEQAEDRGLTVLEASGDLWRGNDEARDGRPDTVRLSEAEIQRIEERRTRRPTQREALEATAARASRRGEGEEG